MTNYTLSFTLRRKSLLIMILLISLSNTKAAINQRAKSMNNYYDQIETEEPIFRDNPPEENEIFGIPPSTALELSADSKFPDLSWEIHQEHQNGNFNQKKRSSPVKRESSSYNNLLEHSNALPNTTIRKLLGSTSKRGDVATTSEELRSKIFNEKEQFQLRKRVVSEHHSCETTYRWMDLGSDHYPRWIRTADCNPQSCANRLYTCSPRHYKVKVLKRFTLSGSAVFEETTDDLPTELRSDWRLITYEITHCCECVRTLARIGNK